MNLGLRSHQQQGHMEMGIVSEQSSRKVGVIDDN